MVRTYPVYVGFSSYSVPGMYEVGEKCKSGKKKKSVHLPDGIRTQRTKTEAKILDKAVLPFLGG